MKRDPYKKLTKMSSRDGVPLESRVVPRRSAKGYILPELFGMSERPGD